MCVRMYFVLCLTSSVPRLMCLCCVAASCSSSQSVALNAPVPGSSPVPQPPASPSGAGGGAGGAQGSQVSPPDDPSDQASLVAVIEAAAAVAEAVTANLPAAVGNLSAGDSGEDEDTEGDDISMSL